MYRNKTWLYQKYWGEELSTRAIAKICGVNHNRIKCSMGKLGIPLRTQIEARNTEGCLELSRERMSGENNYQFGLREERSPNWKGGRKINNCGYVYLKKPSHPKANKDGYVSEHVFVWMNYWKKDIPLNYMVHHKDGNRQNNKIENLLLVDHRDHTNIHKKPVLMETRKKMSESHKIRWGKRRIQNEFI